MADGESGTGSVLDTIVEHKRAHLKVTPPDPKTLHSLAASRGEPRNFVAALLAGPRPALIAECKRRSPVKGLIAEDYDVAIIAREYEMGGASAISVLADAHFDGAPAHVAQAWAAATLPLLFKDFIVDPIQVLEARAHGADCVLLIARILRAAEMVDLVDRAHELGMQVLLEVHDEAEVDVAVAAAPDMLGVNHRNLEDFTLDATMFQRVAARLPAGVPMVAESGFETRAQVTAAADAGARAVLVGTALMRAEDRVAKVRELIGAAA
ncbi:MAG: indole-3-glycerol phosphate synthase TrpC [Candidatus Dormiibacterota bacterium]